MSNQEVSKEERTMIQVSPLHGVGQREIVRLHWTKPHYDQS